MTFDPLATFGLQNALGNATSIAFQKLFQVFVEL
jgi:hypothetical protein